MEMTNLHLARVFLRLTKSFCSAIHFFSSLKLIVISCCFLASNSTSVFAQTNFDLGHSVGRYLAAVDLVMKFNNKECEDIPNTEHLDLEYEISKISKNLPIKLRVELNNYVSSPLFIEDMSENNEIISGFLSQAAKEGISRTGSCQILFAIVSELFKQAGDSVQPFIDY